MTLKDNLASWERAGAWTLYAASVVALSGVTQRWGDFAKLALPLGAFFYLGYASDLGRSSHVRSAFSPTPVRSAANLLGIFFVLLIIGVALQPAILIGMMFVFPLFLTAPGLQSAFFFLDTAVLAYGIADEGWIGDARVAAFAIFLGATFALHHHCERVRRNRAPYHASAARVALTGAAYGALAAAFAFPLHFLIPGLRPVPTVTSGPTRQPTWGDLFMLLGYFALTSFAFTVLLRLVQRFRRVAAELPVLDQGSASVVSQEAMARGQRGPVRPREPRWRVVRLYHDLFERLRTVGVLALDSSTPTERGRSLGRKAPARQQEVDRLTELFHRARYSTDAITPEEVQQMKSWTEVVRRAAQGAGAVLALWASSALAQDPATVNRFARALTLKAKTYEVRAYDLEATIDPAARSLGMEARVRAVPTQDVETLRFLIHSNARISSIRLGGQELKYQLSRFVPQLPTFILDITLPERAKAGTALDLAFSYRFHSPAKPEVHAPTVEADAAWTDLATGWYPAMIYDIFDSRITLDMPEGWDGVATGVKDGDETRGGRRRMSFVSNLPNAMLCFDCGKYRRWEKEQGGRRLAILSFDDVDAKTREEIFKDTADLFEFYTSCYGDPAVPEFAVAHMAASNPSRPHNARSYAILTEGEWKFASRASGEGQSIWYAALSHEIAHCWFGHLVTSDVMGRGGNWLREGLAEYSSYRALERHYGAGPWIYRRALAIYQADMAAFGAKEPPLREMSYMLDHDTSYEKGAWVLRMLADEVGQEAFARALARYVAEKRTGFATDQDFRAIVEKESGKDLRQFVADWEEGSGRLDLAIAGAPTQADKGWTIRLEQRGTLRRAVRARVSWTDKQGAKGTCDATVPAEGAEVGLDCQSEPARVDVNPDTALLDVDPTNDTWPPRVDSGMTLIYASGGFTGDYVASIAEGSPAARAGVRAGDWIVGAADQAVRDPDDVPRALWDLIEGGSLKIRVRRGNDVIEVMLK